MRRGAIGFAVVAIGLGVACGGDDVGRGAPAGDAIRDAVGEVFDQAASDVGEVLTQATRDAADRAESALDAAVERAETAAESAARADARDAAADTLDEMADRIRP